jgi:hypothetical protein
MLSVDEFIRKRKRDIIERWLVEARLAASSRGLERPELANIIPAYLDAVGASGAELGAFTGPRRKHIETLLASRIRLGFSVEEIVDEILLVGRCAQRVWDEAPSDRPAPNEIERLWLELHRAVAAVTEMFTKHMAEDEQSEKRYLRRLRGLASEGVQSGASPLGERMAEALELLKEGAGADSAALLLYDSKSKLLVRTAAVGMEAMERYAAALDPSSFAGQVAASEETTSLEDVTTTNLKIPEELRKSGIQSVLGVKLSARHRLVGVLFVGLCEKRPFTARDARRLEVLGEELALLLDNAALFADLTETVRALRSERELRERFVSVLAHDLRGPLSAGRLATDFLLSQREPSPAKQRELLQRVQRNIDRTDRMVGDLVDANRIHAGERLPLRLGDCDLAMIARAIVPELTAAYGDRFVLGGDEQVKGIWSADELRRSLGTSLSTQ